RAGHGPRAHRDAAIRHSEHQGAVRERPAHDRAVLSARVRLPEARPEPLAMLRVAVPFVALLSPEWLEAARIASQPALATHAPAGLAAIARFVPPSPIAVTIAQPVFVLAAVLAMVGLYTRFAMPVFTA